jgi:hypothetical protein
MPGELQLEGSRVPAGEMFGAPGTWAEGKGSRSFESHEDTAGALRGRLRSGYEAAPLGVRVQHVLPERSWVRGQMALAGPALPEKLLFDSVRFQAGGLTELAGVYPVKSITLPDALDRDAEISATWNAEAAAPARATGDGDNLELEFTAAIDQGRWRSFALSSAPVITVPGRPRSAVPNAPEQASLFGGGRGQVAHVDATTLLALLGIAGTLLGTAIGARGAIGAARVTSRGQAEVEEQKARRQAYALCSTALLSRRDAAVALMEAFRDDDFDLAGAQTRIRDLDNQRGVVAGMVGAVVVEGPYAVADGAQGAAGAVEHLVGRLRDWVGAVAGGEDRQQLVLSQGRYGHDDEREVDQAIDGFAAECRKVLHPAEPERFPLWGRPKRRRLKRRQ